MDRVETKKTKNPQLEQEMSSDMDLPSTSEQTSSNETAEKTGTSEKDLVERVTSMNLKTKKLSGAQRKKLTKQKKIAEGTWTAENPRKRPRKKEEIPKEKGEEVASGSGAKKRPLSDSTTPPSLGRNVKKSRGSHERTGTYSDVASGHKMAVVHKRHPDGTLTQDQADLIQGKVLEAVDNIQPGEQPPQFLGSKFVCGVITMTCANETTRDWLLGTVQGLGPLWEGAELTVVKAADLPKRPRFTVWIPELVDEDKVRKRLSLQNPGLNTADWMLLSKKQAEKGQTMAFSVDQGSEKNLRKNGLKAYWGLGRVTFKPLEASKSAENVGRAEGSSDKPAAQ